MPASIVIVFFLFGATSGDEQHSRENARETELEEAATAHHLSGVPSLHRHPPCRVFVQYAMLTLLQALDEDGFVWGDLVPIEVLLHNILEAGHPASAKLGVTDDNPHGFSRGLGLYLQRAALA